MMDLPNPNRAVSSGDQAKSYRAQACAALAAMQSALLPQVREKHRGAAERWLRMAQSAEALEVRAGAKPAT